MSALFFFFFNDTATTEIYTLSLHDALPISCLEQNTCMRSTNEPFRVRGRSAVSDAEWPLSFSRPPSASGSGRLAVARDRKSTRLNSSHANISYAVFCLKKKKI